MKKISLRWRVTIAAAFVLTLFCVAMTQSSIRDANLIIADPILKLRTEAIADPILNGDQNYLSHYILSHQAPYPAKNFDRH